MLTKEGPAGDCFFLSDQDSLGPLGGVATGMLYGFTASDWDGVGSAVDEVGMVTDGDGVDAAVAAFNPRGTRDSSRTIWAGGKGLERAGPVGIADDNARGPVGMGKDGSGNLSDLGPLGGSLLSIGGFLGSVGAAATAPVGPMGPVEPEDGGNLSSENRGFGGGETGLRFSGEEKRDLDRVETDEGDLERLGELGNPREFSLSLSLSLSRSFSLSRSLSLSRSISRSLTLIRSLSRSRSQSLSLVSHSRSLILSLWYPPHDRSSLPSPPSRPSRYRLGGLGDLLRYPGDLDLDLDLRLFGGGESICPSSSGDSEREAVTPEASLSDSRLDEPPWVWVRSRLRLRLRLRMERTLRVGDRDLSRAGWAVPDQPPRSLSRSLSRSPLSPLSRSRS